MPSGSLNISRYLGEVGSLGVRWENERWDPKTIPDYAVGDPVAISKSLQQKYAVMGTGWASCPAGLESVREQYLKARVASYE